MSAVALKPSLFLKVRHNNAGVFRASRASIRPVCSASEEAKQSPTSTAPEQQLIRITIKKPLGLVLAEKAGSGEVFIDEIVAGGNAEKTKQVRVGDIIAATSAIVLKSGKEGAYEKEGHGSRPYDNFETVEFPCAGEDFKTVLAAIGSNNERWGFMNVTLTLRREETA